MIEIFSVSTLSFLGVIYTSLIIVTIIFSIFIPDMGTDGGLGVALIFSTTAIPIWMIMIVISAIYAKFKFAGKYAFVKRVLFYLIVPIIGATTITGLLAIYLFILLSQF